MKIFRMIALLLALVVPFIIFACNSSDDDSDGDAEVAAIGVSGTVTDADGTPVVGARVIAMDRETDEKFTTLTGDGGAYALPLPEGVYDLAFDDANAHATYFTGPIVMDEDTPIELDAQVAAGSATDDTVYGTITHDTVTDLTGWTVEFVSNVGKNADAKFETVTVPMDAQGAFVALVGGERMMDVNVYDSEGALVEFIDFAKLPGACRLDFTVGTDTPNVYRHDLEAGDHTHDFETNKKVSRSQVSPSATNDVFTLQCDIVGVDDNNNTEQKISMSLLGGKLGVGGGHLKMDAVDSDTNCGSDTVNLYTNIVAAHDWDIDVSNQMIDIELKDDGSWWYDYKVHIYAREGCQGGILYDDIEFEDETHDTYSLSIDDSDWKWHDVSYNSDHPTLIKIKAPIKTLSIYSK